MLFEKDFQRKTLGALLILEPGLADRSPERSFGESLNTDYSLTSNLDMPCSEEDECVKICPV